MRVAVVCFGAVREYLPGPRGDRRADVEVVEGATVADVIQVLGVPSRLVFAILVDGQQGDASQVLRAGSEVTLMPPFAGGASRT